MKGEYYVERMNNNNNKKWYIWIQSGWADYGWMVSSREQGGFYHWEDNWVIYVKEF